MTGETNRGAGAADPGLQIDFLGGNCPVQAEGTIDGVPFYFRSRGDQWSFGVGPEPVGEPEWEHIEPYGEWPEAGWITTGQAMAFIDKAVALYRDRDNQVVDPDNSPAWPIGCRKPGTCARHRECSYVRCSHNGADISKQVDAEVERRWATTRARIEAMCGREK